MRRFGRLRAANTPVQRLLASIATRFSRNPPTCSSPGAVVSGSNNRLNMCSQSVSLFRLICLAKWVGPQECQIFAQQLDERTHVESRRYCPVVQSVEICPLAAANLSCRSASVMRRALPSASMTKNFGPGRLSSLACRSRTRAQFSLRAAASVASRCEASRRRLRASSRSVVC